MRLGIDPLVKRCGINPALRSLVLPIMMSKLNLNPEWIRVSITNFFDISIIPAGLNPIEANKPSALPMINTSVLETINCNIFVCSFMFATIWKFSFVLLKQMTNLNVSITMRYNKVTNYSIFNHMKKKWWNPRNEWGRVRYTRIVPLSLNTLMFYLPYSGRPRRVACDGLGTVACRRHRRLNRLRDGNCRSTDRKGRHHGRRRQWDGLRES
jgi:hypothetical protein